MGGNNGMYSMRFRPLKDPFQARKGFRQENLKISKTHYKYFLLITSIFFLFLCILLLHTIQIILNRLTFFFLCSILFCIKTLLFCFLPPQLQQNKHYYYYVDFF